MNHQNTPNNPKPDGRALRRLAELLLTKTPPPSFKWSHWVAADCTKNSCGTEGCVGGWAATFFPKRLKIDTEQKIIRSARGDVMEGEGAFARAFGLTWAEAASITMGYGIWNEKYDKFSVPPINISARPRAKAAAARRILRVLKVAKARYATVKATGTSIIQ